MYANKPVVKDIQIEGAQLLIDYLSQISQVVDFKVVK
ncbi:lactococcal phosphatase-like protein [Staphylococcus saccharolyticus]|uniref:Lactococcal phosphatase-like protein n=1 Tax=Staphylococcus saccharolyticus TaxID=33028 RepID=A0A380GZK8_9STAP|nr:lactococcal phosphatase-like protein [Staphylococcus saccharolyticus]